MSKLTTNQIQPFSTDQLEILGDGVYIPKLTTAERDAVVSPQDGLVIYNTDTKAIEHYSSGSSSWESSDGITTINGMNAKAQVINTGSSGTAPNVTQTGANTNTVNIPNAVTGGVTAGLVSNTQYTYFKDKQNQVQNVLRVIKNAVLENGDYSTIAAALAAITTNSSSNPYMIEVGPGVYTEAQIQMKPYVWIQGSEQDQTIIQPSNPANHLLLGAPNSGISKCLLTGVTGSGKAAVFYQSTTGTDKDSFFVEDVRFGANDVQAISDATSASSSIFLEEIRFGGNYQFNTGFVAQAGGRIIMRNSTTTSVSTPVPADVFYGTGAGSEIVLNGVQIRNGNAAAGNCIRLNDGAKIRGLSYNAKGWAKGLFVENVGAAPFIEVSGVINESNTMDLVVNHITADGTYFGSADHNKITVAIGSSVGVSITSNATPGDNTGTVVVGSVLQGDRYDRLANLSKIARVATTLGVDEEVGISYITLVSGLQINVAVGTGFLIDPTDLFVKEVSWPSTNVTLSANTNNYIYVDTNSVIQAQPTLPSLETVIPLGRVNTDASAVRFIEASDLPMNHIGNKLEYFLRYVLGPVFNTNCLISESVSNARRLDNTNGVYSYGVSAFTITAGSEFTWEAFRRDGSGGFLSTAGQNTVSNSQYDDNSGSLVSIPASNYAKAHLYVLAEDSGQKWFLVYPQAVYTTLADAVAGPLPTVPTFFNDAVVRVASIIVQQGVTNISEIITITPRIGFAAPSGSAVTDHGSLSGLSDDDHPQYLLTSGTRAMTGPLNMGGQNITSVGTVDGVTVSAHASRHLPSGADALTTAAPSSNLTATTSNATGSANSLARSDHSHAITTGAAASQSPDQANATGSSASIARADHVHNIATAAPSANITATTTNIQGVAATFARSDHGHAVTTGTVSSQTPDQANAAGTSASLTRADHVHNIATAAPTTTLSPATSNTQGSASTFARSDHGHAIATALVADITTIQPDDAAAAGVANTFARGDHKHAIVAAAVSTQTPDQANAEGSSTSFARADHIHAIATAAAISISTSSTNTQGSATSFTRSDHTHVVTITNSEASATADTTTTSATDVLMGSMTLTPVSGTYLAFFSTSLESSADDANIFINIYSGGSLVAHSERQATPNVASSGISNPNGLSIPIATHCLVTVNGSQAIEGRWRRTSGTATAHERTLNVIKVS